jgi:hypothetical protein
MKIERTLFLLALSVTCNITAQQQMEQHATISSAAAISSVGELKLNWLAPSKPADWRKSREPVESSSPQAWTTIVGWHPGQSAFPDLDGKNVSTETPLLWIGQEPSQ